MSNNNGSMSDKGSTDTNILSKIIGPSHGAYAKQEPTDTPSSVGHYTRSAVGTILVFHLIGGMVVAFSLLFGGTVFVLTTVCVAFALLYITIHIIMNTVNKMIVNEIDASE